MKTKHMRGMRDIPTNYGLNNRSLPQTHEQAVTELARLEHEKSRLERELNMWLQNKKSTEARIEKVLERLALVREIMIPPAADGSEQPPTVRRRFPAMQADSDEGETQGWHEISLEY